eukprot:14808088-Ditylum_brightwellii.AAC.2
MHAKTYLSKILKNHGWECRTKGGDKIIEPIHPDLIKKLETMIGPTSEAESNQLEAEEGFSYHDAIGSLIFAYVICHIDIGYAVAKLSKFSASPACCHCKVIKQEPRNDLPEGAHIGRAISGTD